MARRHACREIPIDPHRASPRRGRQIRWRSASSAVAGFNGQLEVLVCLSRCLSCAQFPRLEYWQVRSLEGACDANLLLLSIPHRVRNDRPVNACWRDGFPPDSRFVKLALNCNVATEIIHRFIHRSDCGSGRGPQCARQGTIEHQQWSGFAKLRPRIRPAQRNLRQLCTFA